MAVKEVEKMYTIAENVNDYPAMSGDCVAMGNILLEAGKPAEAIKKYEKAVKLIEKSNVEEEVKQTTRRTSLYNRSRAALAQNDLVTAKARADEYSTQVLALNNPNEVRLLHELKGMIALQEGNYKTAHADLMKSNQQNPNNIYRVAVALEKQGDKKQAKEVCLQAANFNQLNSLNQAFAKHKAKRMLAGM
ncbi:MAG: hypothetical protein JSW34_04240 [Candidatus Zixiibacteriota bacterium]|nr:MAG: hypothetical protein JSW34_04240 [candidate division Zixibacteria bacterium]